MTQRLIRIDVHIDDDCKYCRKALLEFVELISKFPETRLFNPRIRKNKILVVRPDFNASGILTHYHVDIEEDEALRHDER